MIPRYRKAKASRGWGHAVGGACWQLPKGSFFVASLAFGLVLTAARPVQAQQLPFGYTYGPPLPASTFLTPEYNAGLFLPVIGAAEAYRRGITGAGVTIAVMDNGIDVSNREFAGRISAASRNYVVGGVATNLGHIDPTEAHGTEVAGVAAGASNGVGIEGVAYDATLLVLKTSYLTRDTLAAFNAAAASDAKIINASFGPGEPPAGTTKVRIYDPRPTILDRNEQWFPGVLNALQAGKIIVAAAGNSYDTSPIAAANPFGIAIYPYVRPANANTGVYDDAGRNVDFSAVDSAKGQIVSVVAVNSSKQITTYSNRCGVTASWCIAAPGNVVSLENGGDGATTSLIRGTSFAAPVVSGALALYAQALPTFAPRDLVRLMFATTEDLGTPGIDAIYGHGLLRVDQTFNAIGGLLNPVQADTTIARIAAARQFGSIIEGRQMQAAAAGGPAGMPLAFASFDTAPAGLVFGAAGSPVGAAPTITTPQGAWSTVYGGRLRVGENANSGGFYAQTTQVAGGYDRLVAPDLTVGIAGGFSRVTLDENLSLGANSKFDSYQGALYATWTPGPWLIGASLAAARTDITTNRVQPGQVGVISVAHGSTEGYDLAAQVSAGYRFVFDTTTVMPHAGMRFERLGRDGFTESGAGTFDLTLPQERVDGARSTLGVRATSLLPVAGGVTLRPWLDIAWKHDFNDPTPVASNVFFDSTFAVPGAVMPRDAATVDVGLAAYRTDALQIGFNYGVELRRNVTEQRLAGGVLARW